MRPELRDRNGSLIEPGCRVAYNLSGEVALGRVTRLTRGHTTPIFIYRDPQWAPLAKNESRVRHWSSVLVLESPTGERYV